MNAENYIKVTGNGISAVILAANKPFYREHGYTIEQPTDAEIKSAFPEYESAPVESEEAELIKPKRGRKAATAE